MSDASDVSESEETQQVLLVVELTVRPGMQEAAQAAVIDLVEQTHRYDRGVVRFEVGLDPNDDSRVLGYEIWESPAALEEHAREPHTREFLNIAKRFVVNPAVPLQARRWRPMRREVPAVYRDDPRPPAGVPAGFSHAWHDTGDARLHYVIGGSGPPLVLLHGFPNTWFAWRDVMTKLADRRTVIAPDLRGLGDSEPGTLPNDVPTGVADLTHLLNALAVGPVDLAGQDWGGSTAFAFTTAHPDQVRRLAVLEAMPAGPWTKSTGGRAAWFVGLHQLPDLPELLTNGREREYLGWFYRAFSSTEGVPTGEAIEEYLRTYAQPGALASAFARYRGVEQEIEHNGAHLASPLGVPVLALGGERVLGAAVADNLRNAATRVEQLVLPGLGHYLAEEDPRAVADALRHFIAD